MKLNANILAFLALSTFTSALPEVVDIAQDPEALTLRAQNPYQPYEVGVGTRQLHNTGPSTGNGGVFAYIMVSDCTNNFAGRMNSQLCGVYDSGWSVSCSNNNPTQVSSTTQRWGNSYTSSYGSCGISWDIAGERAYVKWCCSPL